MKVAAQPNEELHCHVLPYAACDTPPGSELSSLLEMRLLQ